MYVCVCVCANVCVEMNISANKTKFGIMFLYHAIYLRETSFGYFGPREAVRQGLNFG